MFELRVYQVEAGGRWDFLQRFAHTLGTFFSYRDDTTFVSLHESGADAPAESLVKTHTLVAAHASAITRPEDFARLYEWPVLEIRLYRIRPGMRARFGRFLTERTLEGQARSGMTVYGQFEALDDENLYVFLRGFSDLAERERRKADFYNSRLWLEDLQDEAFSMIEDYSNVLLVMPVSRSRSAAISFLPPYRAHSSGVAS